MKLPPENLNPGPYPPHLTSIYIYGMTTAPRVRGSINSLYRREREREREIRDEFEVTNGVTPCSYYYSINFCCINLLKSIIMVEK